MPIIGSRGAASVRGFGTFGGGDLISASGGSTEDIGEYRVHTFTSSGTFTVDKIAGSVPSPAQAVDYVVVGGGGGGGYGYGAGGGAGGFRESHVEAISGPYTASPLASTTSIPISVSPGSYPITVGAGGGTVVPPSGGDGQNGAASSFSTITASGGGHGGGNNQGSGNPGGSGGGGGNNGGGPAGGGNSGGYSPPEGNGGGAGSPQTGGGGGAGASGTAAGPGGAGVGTEISATAGIQGPSAPLRYFAGGGSPSQIATGGGGVGGGGGSPYNTTTPTFPGPTNKGQPGTGGGSRGDFYNNPQVGGPGVVIIRYKYK